MLFLLSALITLWFSPFLFLIGMMAIAALWHPSWRRRESPGRRAAVDQDESPRFAILIPAHDEELVISRTIASLRTLHYPVDQYDIFVVADNCTDDTAEIAQAAGAIVIERHDEADRGKGFALAHGLQEILTSAAYQEITAVVIVDADTVVDKDLLPAFAQAVAAGYDFMQGYYNGLNPDESWRTQLLFYALSLINGVWLAGEQGLELGASLRGNGMCFTRRGLERVPWQASGLAEDMEFGWLLRLQGERVGFVPEAKVFGELVAQDGDAAASQRQRWEHGRKALRPQFRQAILTAPKFSPLKKAMLLINLYMEPIAKLAGFWLVAVLCHLLASRSSTFMAWLQLFGGLSLVFYALLPLALLHVPPAYLVSLKHLPKYVWWKLTLLLQTKPKEWVRTEREVRGDEGEPNDDI